MVSRIWTKSELLMNGGVRLALYKSSRSKLIVAVGDVPGPMVNGLVSFVTETDRDDGLPHTLEHLVFMGSHKYPYKGVLDIIANRCLADGTNAWTDQDHTAYTLSTVGSEGFLKVLPVYINHLLSPMLSESQFMTEVHHINGQGEDAGVVYSEMQDHESEMENMMDKKMKEIVYPAANPYAVDTGGKLKALRESCNIHSVRDFHKRFYHLSNMVVTICGKIDHERLLKIMETVEEEHLANVPASFTQPFSFALSPIKESSVHKIICPSDDETCGIVDINWFAHKPSDVSTGCALEVMFDYMSNTPVAPLQKDFILIPSPLASSAQFHISEQVICLIHLQFSGVPLDQLDAVRQKFLEKTLVELLESKTWDMERMGFLIDQTIQNELVKAEKCAHQEVFGHIIGHQLYGGDDDGALKERIDQISLLKTLREKPANFWSTLVKTYFSQPSVTVLGVPSEKMVQKIANEEKQRLDAQRKRLGDKGVKDCGEKINQAIKENTANKPTKELLDEMIVRDLENFDRFPVVTVSNTGEQQSDAGQFNANFIAQFPFTTFIHNCPTNFVELFMLFDSSQLTTEQRAWLMLYNELLFESSAMINGELKSPEEVAKLYTKDLIDHSVEVGVSGHFDRFVNLRLKVPTGQFANLAKWAEVFTKGIVFNIDRVKMCAQKLASEARDRKRDGSSVASTSLSSLVYNENSNSHLYDVLILETFHESIVKMCGTSPAEVISKLEEIRGALFAQGINAHVICDSRLVDEKIYGPQLWNFATNGFGESKRFQCKTGDAVDEGCIGKQKVIAVGGSESSFIDQTCLIDSDWLGESLLPTMLFTQYLSQCEGPLWNGIRGVGLAYGANIYVKADRKSLSLCLYRCSQPGQAYEQTRKIVMDIVSSGKIDESEFEAAKRSLVFELMSREGTVSAAGKLAILGCLRNTPMNFNKTVCEKIWNMTSSEMLKVGGPRVANLFDNYVRAIAVHPQKVNEMLKAFPGIEQAPLSSLRYGNIKNGKSKRKVGRLVRNLNCCNKKSKKD